MKEEKCGNQRGNTSLMTYIYAYDNMNTEKKV